VTSTSNVSCHETQSFPLQWAKASTLHDIYDTLHARLLYPFSDVICIFADDFPDIESVVARLQRWATTSGGTTFEKVKPCIIIIKRGAMESNSPTHDLLEMQDVRFSLDKKKLRQSFSTIKVLHLADGQISPLARFRRLKELIWRQMDEMRNVRLRHKGCVSHGSFYPSPFQLYYCKSIGQRS